MELGNIFSRQHIFIKVFGFLLTLYILYEARKIILIFVTAIIFSILFHPIVTWLNRYKVPRGIGTVIVLLLIVALFGITILLMYTFLPDSFNNLKDNVLPQVIASMGQYVENTFGINVAAQDLYERVRSFASSSVQDIAAFLFSYATSLIEIAILTLTFVSTVAYILIDPKPLLNLYISLFPTEYQEKAWNAFRKGAKGIYGWMQSSLIIGLIQAVIITIFLYFLGIPAAPVWGFFIFIGEQVPYIGPLVMTIIPVTVAFSIDPTKGLIVLVFYTAIMQIMENVIAPKIRAKGMKMNPVLVIVIIVLFSHLFGLLGAIIAVPVAGFIKAFFEEFYLKDHKKQKDVQKDITDFAGY
jgi:putative permease